MIVQMADQYLPKAKLEQLQELIEKTLSIKISHGHALKAYMECLSGTKMPSENLLISYSNLATKYAISITENDIPEYHNFKIALNLVKKGITTEIPPSTCFLVLGMMEEKAPLFLFEDGNKVIFDPYLDFLESLCLVDRGSEEKNQLIHKHKEEVLLSWIKRLELSEKPHIVSYAKDIQVIYTPAYEKLGVFRMYIDRFKNTIEQFITNETNEKDFKSDMSIHLALAVKNFPVRSLSKYNDPCITATAELAHHLQDREKRDRCHTAIVHMLSEWKQKIAEPPPHIQEVQTYFNFRSFTENFLHSQLSLLKMNKMSHSEFQTQVTMHIFNLYNSYIPDNIHLMDPVFDALNMMSLPGMDRLEFLKQWQQILKGSIEPAANYHAKFVANYIENESKQLK